MGARRGKGVGVTLRDAAKAGALREWCEGQLKDNADGEKSDPLNNEVRRLACVLSDQLAAGGLKIADVAALVKEVSDDGFLARARRLGAVHPLDADYLAPAVEAVLSPFASQPFEALAAHLSQTRAGVVFTAHPTFAMSRSLRRTLADCARAEVERVRAGVTTFTEGLSSKLKALTHRPDETITLADEHADAISAIENAQYAISELVHEIFSWARKHFPDQWRDLRPHPVSLATWVGYDLDGRTDIHWTTTLEIRLSEKARQLDRYATQLASLGYPLGSSIDRLQRQLKASSEEAAEIAVAFRNAAEDPSRLVAAANRLTASGATRLTSLASAIDVLDAEIASQPKLDVAQMAALARTCMENFGLGVGRVHLRLNAAQIRSALQNELGLSAGREVLDRTTLDSAAELAAVARARNVNFSSLFAEKTTARRQFMLCAQIIKHIDADAPIRFLIAECEAPATVMGAIYLARLYGVDTHIDISPLFETPEAIERGGRLIERLLEEPEFLAYVNGRGRLAIQLGFSDSGRFMGQIAANLAIERLQILTARSLARKGLTNVEVIIFNTHGESLGRGGYIGGLSERLDYLMTPWARARFAHENIPLNCEVSFQGGDGYIHFDNVQLAASTIGTVFRWAMTPPVRDPSDAYYGDINFSWDVYRAIKSWQEHLFETPHYQTALSAFAPGFLPVTGSRKTRRQSGASKGDGARALRAIPHNAILQQLAAPANVFGGLGFAAAREPDRFATWAAASPRIQQVVRLAHAARELTSLSILRSYAGLYDPSLWTVRARHSASVQQAMVYSAIADRLDVRGIDVSLSRLTNLLSVDRRKFDTAVNAPPGVESDRFSADLYVLHAARIALIMHAFTLVASLPAFSPRHDVTQDSLIDLALSLNLTEIAGTIVEIFPTSGQGASELSGLTEPADPLDDIAGYPEIERRFARPLLEIDVILKDITVGISHFYGAFG